MAIVTEQDGGYINTGNVLRANLWMALQNQVGICGCAFACTGDTGFGITAGEFANVIQTATDPKQQLLLNTTTLILGCKTTFLPPGQINKAGIASSTSVGSLSAVPLPTQDTGIVSLNTLKSGRAYRGRFYFPFPLVSQLDATDSTPTAAYVTALKNLADALVKTWNVVGAGGTATLVPTIYHRANQTNDQIIGYVAKKLWATQRRRGDYGRLNSPIIT